MQVIRFASSLTGDRTASVLGKNESNFVALEEAAIPGTRGVKVKTKEESKALFGKKIIIIKKKIENSAAA